MGIYGIWVDVYRYQRKIAEERAPEKFQLFGGANN